MHRWMKHKYQKYRQWKQLSHHEAQKGTTLVASNLVTKFVKRLLFSAELFWSCKAVSRVSGEKPNISFSGTFMVATIVTWGEMVRRQQPDGELPCHSPRMAASEIGELEEMPLVYHKMHSCCKDKCSDICHFPLQWCLTARRLSGAVW